MRSLIALGIVSVLFCACREKPAEPVVRTSPTTSSPPAIAASPPATSAPAAPASRLECKVDKDCTNSCRHGAVNLRWWQASYPGDEGCEDGCTSKGTDPARCEAEKCVAYAFGKPAKVCTSLEHEVVAGPGPAHRCSTAEDCMSSCRYGAVNRNWYGYAAKNECKDGCAGKGAEAPRCENGSCAAYSRGQPDPRCTKKSIHQPP